MQFYGKSQEVSNRLIESFRSGDIPAALSQIFIENPDVPCSKWSWNNRILVALGETMDARGFKQWLEVGRCVKKGSKAIHILAPITRKRKDANGDDSYFVVGFKAIPVFRIEDTEGDPVERPEVVNFLESLPLREVADHWEVSVNAFSGEAAGFHGYYQYSDSGEAIALGVENISTFLHELMHCADNKCGNLVKGKGQEVSNEVVAEMGGAVLATMLGYETEADMGGAWEYILHYSDGSKEKAISNLMKFLDRMCQAIDLILTTAESLKPVEA